MYVLIKVYILLSKNTENGEVKKMKLKTSIILLLLIVLSIASLSVFILSYRALGVAPGIYLEFEFLRNVGESYVNVAPELSKSKDIHTCVYAEVILPKPPDFSLLGSGCYEGIPVIYISYDKVREVVDQWVLQLRSQGTPDKVVDEHVFGLILRTYVINVTNKEILYAILDSVPLRIGDFRSPQIVKYVVRNLEGWNQALIEKFVGASSSSQVESLDYEASYGYVKRTLVAEIRPENLTGELPSDYFRDVGGILYLKTPLLILENVLPLSGVITGSIQLYRSDASIVVRLSFSTGDILNKLRNSTYPTTNFQLGGTTWGGSRYYYAAANYVLPNQTKWAYMWARPLQRYWRVEVCYYDVCFYIRDEVETIITDILTSGLWIPGGWENGLPHDTIMNNLYLGTNITQPIIPNTTLADGYLSVDESITFRYVFQYFDACGGDFEVGLPVGAFLATATCTALEIPSGGTACVVATAFASAFQVSIGFEGVQIFADGGLQNLGNEDGAGYNVVESIYVRISKYRYQTPPSWWCPWCSPCTYNVPAGIHFRCW